MAGSEEVAVSFSDQSGSKMKKLFMKPSRLPTPIVRDKIFTVPEPMQWSSNSTVDSFCSTNNIATDVSGEIPQDELTVENESSFMKKVKKKRGSESSIRSSGCLANLNIRRLSNSSGQWKGVRWKPVIYERTGDVWSDNISLRKPDIQASETSKKTDDIKAQSKPCLNSQGDLMGWRRDTNPLSRSLSQRWRCKAYHIGCPAYNNIRNETLGHSMPNLQLSDYTSNKDVESVDKE